MIKNLLQNTTQLAQAIWAHYLSPQLASGAYAAVDATCGRGNDTVWLTAHCGRVYAFDIQPDAIAIEELFFNTNVTTGIHVGHARGVIVLACAEAGYDPAEYTPLEVKQAVVGYGRAEKRQVMEMTRVLLNLDHIPRPDDAADALAIAICHAHTAGSSLSGVR